ncbi:MAG: MBL fold metallo-hydrolase [Muribaculaceae bacterium]|nr:MBL fold metallo-hydrolase [Muribaculaceae bacterium]
MARRKITFEGQMKLPFEEWEVLDTRPTKPVRRNVYAAAEIPVPEKKEPLPEDRLLYYFSIGSGSSGNSCYVGTRKGGILIDAGVKADIIESTLASNGIDMKKVVGVLLTHDHSDHVRYVYTLLRNHRHIRLYCTNRVLTGILRRHSISKRIKDYHSPIFKEIPFKLADLEITAFEVPHDGVDNMGFSITFDDRNFVLATDLGAVKERARHYMSRANYLVIEANYDLRMLLNGSYPEYLKARIQTEAGHMDNVATAAFLKEIVNPDLKNIFLCHLSKDNNTPQKALKAVRDALEEKGLKVGNAEDTLEDRKSDVQLMALPRFESSRLFVFRPLGKSLSQKEGEE